MLNNFKTFALLVALTLILVLAGQYFGGQKGMIVAFLLAVGMNFAAYFYSDKIALASYGAQPLPEEEAPQLYATVARLTQRAGLPMPKIYLVPSPSPNAFATGRDPEHAVVAVTDGILRLLGPDELEGVLAHELGHVKNRDILISSVAATVAGAIMMLAKLGFFFGGMGDREDDRDSPLRGAAAILFFILAPIAAMLVQLAISRAREFQADASGAELSGGPYGLARALQKLEQGASQIPLQGATPATSHLMIVRPFAGGLMTTLFSTHPPIPERIRRLTGIESV